MKSVVLVFKSPLLPQNKSITYFSAIAISMLLFLSSVQLVFSFEASKIHKIVRQWKIFFTSKLRCGLHVWLIKEGNRIIKHIVL